MKKCFISIAMLLMLTFIFSSCGTNVEEIMQRFDECEYDKDTVVVLDESTFYFTDHTLKLKDIVSGEEPNGGYLFLNGKLYFSTVKENKAFDFSFYIYECDTHGENKKIVFEKHGYKTKPWAVGKDGIIYLEYYETNALEPSSRRIDFYDIFNGVYENASSGNETSLSHYEKDANEKYSFDVDDTILTITDKQKNTSYNIDGNKMLDSTFGETLEGLEYTFVNATEMNDGQIFLMCRIESNGLPYPFFVCEYIPQTDEIVFRTLVFTYDCESVEVNKIT